MPCVYFVSPANRTDIIKVGMTAGSARVRLRALQTGSPDVLEVIETLDIPAGKGAEQRARTIEQRLHAMWAPYRRHGEWFAWEGDVARFLDDTSRPIGSACPACLRWRSLVWPVGPPSEPCVCDYRFKCVSCGKGAEEGHYLTEWVFGRKCLQCLRWLAVEDHPLSGRARDAFHRGCSSAGFDSLMGFLDERVKL